MSSMFSEVFYVTPSDVKQYFFCRRIPFLMHALGVRERTTWSMEEGKKSHEELRRKEERRVTVALKRKWKGWEKSFGIRLECAELGLAGVLDVLLRRGGEYVPLEFKDAEKPAGKVPPNHLYQLAAYAVMVERLFNTVVRRGLIYYAQSDALVEVPLTVERKRYVEKVVREIRDTIEGGRIPKPSRLRGKCAGCGFRHYCLGV